MRRTEALVGVYLDVDSLLGVRPSLIRAAIARLQGPHIQLLVQREAIDLLRRDGSSAALLWAGLLKRARSNQTLCLVNSVPEAGVGAVVHGPKAAGVVAQHAVRVSLEQLLAGVVQIPPLIAATVPAGTPGELLWARLIAQLSAAGTGTHVILADRYFFKIGDFDRAIDRLHQLCERAERVEILAGVPDPEASDHAVVTKNVERLRAAATTRMPLRRGVSVVLVNLEQFGRRLHDRYAAVGSTVVWMGVGFRMFCVETVDQPGVFVADPNAHDALVGIERNLRKNGRLAWAAQAA